MIILVTETDGGNKKDGDLNTDNTTTNINSNGNSGEYSNSSNRQQRLW